MNLTARAMSIAQDCNQYGVRLVQSVQSRKLMLVENEQGEYGCSESVYKWLQQKITAFNTRIDKPSWQDRWE
jgi:hypothetical protein